jgi:hypothetical protein
MYCPQCSQQEVSGEMRFCSRCGFPLTIVSQLVANGGALAGFDTEGKPQRSRCQKGIRTGAMMMIVSGLLIPTVTMLTAMKSDLVFLFGPVLLVFLYGLVRLLYALIMKPSTALETQTQLAATSAMSEQSNSSRNAALPAHESMPISNWRQPINTSEMAQPSSVTDNTTKLL